MKNDNEKERIKRDLERYKGGYFSTEGICTLKRLWINAIVAKIIGKNFTFLANQILNLDSSLKPLSIALLFWLICFYLFFEFHICCLEIQRLRSINENPWKFLIPFIGPALAHCVPTYTDFKSNSYINYKIKYKPLFIILWFLEMLLYMFIYELLF